MYSRLQLLRKVLVVSANGAVPSMNPSQPSLRRTPPYAWPGLTIRTCNKACGNKVTPENMQKKALHVPTDCHHGSVLVESGGFRPGDEVVASGAVSILALLVTGLAPCRVLSVSSPISCLVLLRSMTWAAEARN